MCCGRGEDHESITGGGYFDMNTATRRFVYWTPRILGILFAVFLSVFALDVFSEGHGFWKTIVALLMHLVPTFIFLVVLIVAWRWEWIGGLVFIASALWYVMWTWGRFTGQHIWGSPAPYC
jgi:hypothetical protein